MQVVLTVNAVITRNYALTILHHNYTVITRNWARHCYSVITKGLSYGSSFFPNGIPAPQANFFKEYSRYTFKKSALLSKEEGTPEIISRPANFFLKACHTTTHQRQIYCSGPKSNRRQTSV
jgi:hypothetical protein